MQLEFEKWQGCLNDFLVVRLTQNDGDLVLDALKRQAPRICDRRAGVGGDGILVLHVKDHRDLDPKRLTIINSDGSVAKNCGNGLRCAARSVLRRQQRERDDSLIPDAIELEVEGRLMTCRLLSKGSSPLVAVDMGIPKVNDAVPWHDEGVEIVARVARELGIPELAEDVASCDIGNPHVVLTVDRATEEDMLIIGKALQAEPLWDGVNVHLVHAEEPTSDDQRRAGGELGQKIAQVYKAWVWERGAGPTHACGSGACAIAACAAETGMLRSDAWVAVDMPGGRLYVKYQGADEPCILAGPAELSFEGRVEI